jgi:hypothetical protein
MCAWFRSIFSRWSWGVWRLPRYLLADECQAPLHALHTLRAFLQACLCTVEAFQGFGLRCLGHLQSLKYALFAFVQFLWRILFL